MNFKSFFLRFFTVLTAIIVVSCDKDFNEIGTDIVGGDNDHYLFDKYADASIKAYNQKLGPVAMHNLPINPLGIYKNPVFGTTTSGFVSQLEMASGSINRVFNNTDPDLYQELPVIDSVILNVPYYSKLLSTDSDGLKTYRLDSIYGGNETKMKLSVYESNYFLRDLDPSSQFTEQQVFYNDNQEVENQKNPFVLNNSTNTKENTQFFFDKSEHKTTVLNSSNVEVPTRTAPSMRLHLDKTFFYNKILNAPSGQLVNNAVFKNYFRGLYFKVEDLGTSNNMAMINFSNAKATIYYREDKKVTNSTTNVVTFEKTSKTFEMNFAGNRVSLQSNSNEDLDYLAAANSTSEASKLYLKGGQGSMAIIDLFGPDTDNNGVADELEQIKNNGWLINEANLTFYIDKTAMSNTQAIEPNRIMLYDLNNSTVLVDYLIDQSQSGRYPKQNKFIHGGILLDDDGVFVKQIKDENTGIISNKGTKYKIRLTSHIKNLIKNDSTNVRLGLVVTESINTIGYTKLKTPIGDIKKVPQMSVLSPVGTILYGTNIPVGDINYGNRLKLEIYYTKPD
ncbi:DUF4270 domain-containing protein [Flavobacterium capsici]|uniref:DUF4270 domain-containing protein n=1 Tax=Flavobacterium capsici TaxID=3075618 RepID=A0AA96EYU2_9FLAO|nr:MULTISPECIES: DUF4270 domain-containing protein [unclassified Flavobacterium]WNM19794.1 DUF4270 domain-containing protein [Flavobacterium sp. PMR2A8]WNM21183.1 DUF4270 domain-containing protein [Flavobacterium sp. PMTSA4]